MWWVMKTSVKEKISCLLMCRSKRGLTAACDELKWRWLHMMNWILVRYWGIYFAIDIGAQLAGIKHEEGWAVWLTLLSVAARDIEKEENADGPTRILAIERNVVFCLEAKSSRWIAFSGPCLASGPVSQVQQTGKHVEIYMEKGFLISHQVSPFLLIIWWCHGPVGIRGSVTCQIKYSAPFFKKGYTIFFVVLVLIVPFFYSTGCRHFSFVYCKLVHMQRP